MGRRKKEGTPWIEIEGLVNKLVNVCIGYGAVADSLNSFNV